MAKNPKMRCCSFKQTYKDKLKDLAETRKIDEALIKHYTFILEHFDEIIATHDKDIAEVEKKKAEILKQFIEAPKKLIQLNANLVELQKKAKTIRDSATGKVQKIKRVKSLRERLVVLQQECKDEGIDIEQVLSENI